MKNIFYSKKSLKPERRVTIECKLGKISKLTMASQNTILAFLCVWCLTLNGINTELHLQALCPTTETEQILKDTWGLSPVTETWQILKYTWGLCPVTETWQILKYTHRHSKSKHGETQGAQLTHRYVVAEDLGRFIRDKNEAWLWHQTHGVQVRLWLYWCVRLALQHTCTHKHSGHWHFMQDAGFTSFCLLKISTTKSDITKKKLLILFLKSNPHFMQSLQHTHTHE